MRQHAPNGGRHATLRQFERLARALRRELGVAPAARRRHSVTASSPSTTWVGRDDPLIGRDFEMAIAERALLDSAAGRSRTLIVSDPAGVGMSSLLAAIAAREGGEFLCRPLNVGARRGAWPYAHSMTRACRSRRDCRLIATAVSAAPVPGICGQDRESDCDLLQRFSATPLHHHNTSPRCRRACRR
jgi:hypothetical protein